MRYGRILSLRTTEQVFTDSAYGYDYKFVDSEDGVLVKRVKSGYSWNNGVILEIFDKDTKKFSLAINHAFGGYFTNMSEAIDAVEDYIIETQP